MTTPRKGGGLGARIGRLLDRLTRMENVQHRGYGAGDYLDFAEGDAQVHREFSTGDLRKDDK